MNSLIQSFSKTLGFFVALVLIVFFIILIVNLGGERKDNYFEYIKGDKKSDKIIALINLSGPIIDEQNNLYNYGLINNIEAIYPSIIENYLEELKKLEINGIVVSVNSPGGSVSASQKIYNLFKNFKIENNIPLYFHGAGTLVSGGYWISLAGDKVFADYGTIIGSIGVKGPNWLYYNSPTALSKGLLGNSVESPNGIKLFSNSAGLYKDIFNPFRQPTKIEIFKLQEMIDDIYFDFVNLVSNNRKIEKEIITNEIGAMIFNTKKAKINFLIDNQKNLKETYQLMSKKLNLSNFKIISNKKSSSYNFFNLKILKYLNKNFSIDKESIVKESFCNNFNNQFSSVSLNLSKINC